MFSRHIVCHPGNRTSHHISTSIQKDTIEHSPGILFDADNFKHLLWPWMNRNVSILSHVNIVNSLSLIHNIFGGGFHTHNEWSTIEYSRVLMKYSSMMQACIGNFFVKLFFQPFQTFFSERCVKKKIYLSKLFTFVYKPFKTIFTNLQTFSDIL